ncbi:RNA-directed DNA polymerase, eukaryota, reverse transcriptase zinc-binding domain protein [Tanacetum coccineum]
MEHYSLSFNFPSCQIKGLSKLRGDLDHSSDGERNGRINIHKSQILGVGVPRSRVEDMASSLGCTIMENKFCYLGVMVRAGMIRHKAWDDVPKGVLKVMESIRSNFFKGASMLEKKFPGLLGISCVRVCLALDSVPIICVEAKWWPHGYVFSGSGSRTRCPTDRLCLYIDVEEHDLGNLGEPAYYKAALKDPEFEKWQAAINVKIQSMKDNNVWDLVELPPNAKTVGHKWIFKKKTDMDGAVHTFKSRLVAKGFTQIYGVDYEETFSLIADIRALRILIAVTFHIFSTPLLPFRCDLILGVLQMVPEPRILLYLGLVVGGSMSRVHAWNEVVERVKKRLSKWKMKTLSIGGRLTFYTQYSSLWARVIKAIHGDDGKMGVITRAGSKSCWMNIVHETNALLNKGIDIIKFMRIKLGNGQITSFWEDMWSEGGTLKNWYTRIYALESSKSITVGMKVAQPSLAFSFRRAPRGGVEQEQFDEIVALVNDVILAPISDRWTWTLESSGDFFVASVRKLIDDKSIPAVDFKTRWIKYVSIKVNVHAWKVKSNSLPTRFNISRRGIYIDSIMCAICDKGAETSSHLFFSCCMVRQVVRLITRWWDVPYMEFESYDGWLAWLVNLRLPYKNKMMLEGVFYVMWWHLWTFRNKTIFEAKAPAKALFFDDVVWVHDKMGTQAYVSQPDWSADNCKT